MFKKRYRRFRLVWDYAEGQFFIFYFCRIAQVLEHRFPSAACHLPSYHTVFRVISRPKDLLSSLRLSAFVATTSSWYTHSCFSSGVVKSCDFLTLIWSFGFFHIHLWIWSRLKGLFLGFGQRFIDSCLRGYLCDNRTERRFQFWSPCFCHWVRRLFGLVSCRLSLSGVRVRRLRWLFA